MGGNFVIAGGSKGIGLEIVNQLLPFADRIDVLARSRGELADHEKVVRHDMDFTSENLDFSNIPDIVHGVVYCPGTINLRSFRALKPADFVTDFEVNLLGAVKFLQGCLPALKKGAAEKTASVVMFSTVAVSQGLSMHASVAAAKGAVEGLTRSLAAEWAPKIRVNCIAPALTDTPLASRFFSSPENREAMAVKYPLGRTGLPTDLAATARFLLTNESSWMTGQVLAVDGGMSTLRK
ncbi:SDR family oxidoreductase [Mariniblastus sp.]|nr:SDR family oxidoreductase [Mariniblastus sp.]MDA7903079.1 SDR family oxidoreductase [Mariniblastus sp.]MDA7923129.1 SDR family oxidoreductase [bacterium]MDB4386513.1 SDR family oxidoreductase [bacterium]MDB4472994.1 SDR family oxidoreductase [bacterium]